MAYCRDCLNVLKLLYIKLWMHHSRDRHNHHWTKTWIPYKSQPFQIEGFLEFQEHTKFFLLYLIDFKSNHNVEPNFLITKWAKPPIILALKLMSHFLKHFNNYSFLITCLEVLLQNINQCLHGIGLSWALGCWLQGQLDVEQNFQIALNVFFIFFLQKTQVVVFKHSRSTCTTTLDFYR